MLCGFILHPSSFFTHLDASRGSWGLRDVGACTSLDAYAAFAILAALKERVGQAPRLAPERVAYWSRQGSLRPFVYFTNYVLTANIVPSLVCPTEARYVSPGPALASGDLKSTQSIRAWPQLALAIWQARNLKRTG